jgi:cilia- and flagella-associated protein 298
LPADKKKWAYPTPEGNQRVNEDKSGYRCGICVAEEFAKILKDEVMKAKEYISKVQIERNVCMEKKKLYEILEHLRGAVMIAYPGYHGLPYWEPVVEMLENKINYLAVFPDCEVPIQFLEEVFTMKLAWALKSWFI